MNKYLIRKIIITTVFATLTASLAFAAEISLSWDPSPSSSVEGYKVYYKTDDAELPFDGTGADQGASPIDVGDTLSTTLTGLNDSATYFFTVTAYDAPGNESNPANIVSSSSLVPELLAPLDKTNNEPIPVTFRWSTNAGMTYVLHYGTDPELAAVPAPAPFRFSFQPAAPQSLIVFLLCLSLASLIAKQLPKRKKIGLAAAVFTVGILSACGGGGGGDGSSNDSRATAPPETEIQQPATDIDAQPQTPETGGQQPAATQTLFTVDVGTADYYQAYDVEPGTTYYWKVVATDVADPSQSYSSATKQFTTEVY